MRCPQKAQMPPKQALHHLVQDQKNRPLYVMETTRGRLNARRARFLFLGHPSHSHPRTAVYVAVVVQLLCSLLPAREPSESRSATPWHDSLI